jgi:hypothetical protein
MNGIHGKEKVDWREPALVFQNPEHMAFFGRYMGTLGLLLRSCRRMREGIWGMGEIQTYQRTGAARARTAEVDRDGTTELALPSSPLSSATLVELLYTTWPLSTTSVELQSPALTDIVGLQDQY